MLRDLEYNTTDVLYALDGDLSDKYSLRAGNGNNKVLPMSTYWSGSDRFWLRSPNASLTEYALTGDSGVSISGDNVNDKHMVQPASNLNVSSVLFASAATVASDTVEAGTIASDSAMTLRLDGSNKQIGTVLFDAATGIIQGEKNENATGTVSLVVQGKNDNQDWFYSINVEDKVLVSAEDICSEVGISDLDLSVCKIWMETTEENVIYSVNASEVKFVSRIEVSIDTPMGGKPFNNEVQTTTTGVEKVTLKWTDTDGNPVTGNAEYYSWAYVANITFEAEDEYMFPYIVEVIINDGEVGLEPGCDVLNTDGTYSIKSDIIYSTKREITGVVSPQVSEGNVFEHYYYTEDIVLDIAHGNELGASATITYKDGGTESVGVEWSVVGNYDSTPGAKNTFKWTVTGKDFGDYIIGDGVAFEGTVDMFNKADETIIYDVTVTAEDQTIVYGDSIDTTKYMITGLLEGHRINAVTLIPSTSDVTDNGTIEVSIDKIVDELGEDVTANYDVICISGKLIIKEAEKETEEETVIDEITDGINSEGKTDDDKKEDATTKDSDSKTDEKEDTTTKDSDIKDDEKVEPPATGDHSSPIGVWLVCLIICGFVAVGLYGRFCILASDKD